MPGDSAETVSPMFKLLLKKVIKNFCAALIFTYHAMTRLLQITNKTETK